MSYAHPLVCCRADTLLLLDPCFYFLPGYLCCSAPCTFVVLPQPFLMFCCRHSRSHILCTHCATFGCEHSSSHFLLRCPWFGLCYVVLHPLMLLYPADALWDVLLHTLIDLLRQQALCFASLSWCCPLCSFFTFALTLLSFMACSHFLPSLYALCYFLMHALKVSFPTHAPSVPSLSLRCALCFSTYDRCLLRFVASACTQVCKSYVCTLLCFIARTRGSLPIHAPWDPGAPLRYRSLLSRYTHVCFASFPPWRCFPSCELPSRYHTLGMHLCCVAVVFTPSLFVFWVCCCFLGHLIKQQRRISTAFLNSEKRILFSVFPVAV